MKKEKAKCCIITWTLPNHVILTSYETYWLPTSNPVGIAEHLANVSWEWDVPTLKENFFQQYFIPAPNLLPVQAQTLVLQFSIVPIC